MIRLLTILLFLTTQANAAGYYISSLSGSNVYPGTSKGFPWATLSKLAATPPVLGDTVWFERGSAWHETFPTPVSGVTYIAYGTGAMPVVTGFVALTTWTNVGTNLWETSLSAGATLNMVTVGGAIQEPGRFPNTGWLTMNVPDINSQGQKIGNTSRFYASTTGLTGFAGANIVQKKREWVIEKNAVLTISGDSVTFGNATGFPALDQWGYYLTDHPLALDQQNEWYYTGSTLRMYSTVNPGPLNVKASTTDVILSMTSKSNVTFNNITFEGSNLNTVNISSGSGNSLINCNIQFSGRNGIAAEYQTSLTISGDTVRNTNWSGIDALFGTYQYLTNNQVYNCGLKTSLCQNNNKANHGIWVNGTYNRITKNHVSYIGYVGIDMSGSYDTCRLNYVHHFDQTSADGGGIYMSDEPAGVGRLIDSNVVVFGLGPRDGTPYTGFDNAMGIYLDEATGGVTITNNFSAFNAGGGLYLHRAHNIVVRNNTFYANTHQQVLIAEDGPEAQRVTNIEFTGNVMHSATSSDYIYVLYAVGGAENFFSRMSNNILSRPASSTNLIREVVDYFAGGDYSYSLAQWKSDFPNYDVLSTGTPSAFTSGSPVVQTSFGTVSFVTLDAVYQGIRGTLYGAGTVVLQPYSGEVLIKTEEFTPVVAVPITVKGRRIR